MTIDIESRRNAIAAAAAIIAGESASAKADNLAAHKSKEVQQQLAVIRGHLEAWQVETGACGLLPALQKAEDECQKGMGAQNPVLIASWDGVVLAVDRLLHPEKYDDLRPIDLSNILS